MAATIQMSDAFVAHAVRCSLIDYLDKSLMVVLRDGKKTFDQYSNIVLEDTIERKFHASSYADVPMGLYLIRGENVVLMGDMDAEKEKESLKAFKKVSEEELQKALSEKKQADDQPTPEYLKMLKEDPEFSDFPLLPS